MGVSLQPSTPIRHNTSLLDPETHSLSTENSKETRIMSLHWTLIAGFLYAEIGALLLLLLPFISPRMWNKLIKGIENQFIYYFYVLVTILILFFLDAIREIRKYSSEEQNQKTSQMSHLDAQMQMHMRLFRAQRNFYIAGFALFLCLVIKRLVSLISANAGLQAEKDAAMKQAESASRAAEAFMKGDAGAGDDTKDVKEALAKAEKEATAAKKDRDSMKAQSESLTKEYDRLLAEKDKLERKVNIQGGGDKDD